MAKSSIRINKALLLIISKDFILQWNANFAKKYEICSASLHKKGNNYLKMGHALNDHKSKL